MKNILLVVDCQYDFVNPNGSLFVKGSENLPERIASIMDKFDYVVFTLDWHPYNHFSFIENGGQWPLHCVANSLGASIPDVLLQAASKKPKLCLYKGRLISCEEYSAFGNDKNIEDFSMFVRMHCNDKYNVFVCGVAGDYCVSRTVKDVMDLKNGYFDTFPGERDVYIMKDLCPCINTSFDLEAFSKEHGVICINSNECFSKEKRITPSWITSLKDNEVFVFGSNLAGMHEGGAARVAVEKFGAVWGQGVGLQGQSYAIPTMQGGVETIKPYVEEFIDFAKQHTEKTFLVTPIGCGIAGFTEEEIAPLFKDAVDAENVYLPEKFYQFI